MEIAQRGQGGSIPWEMTYHWLAQMRRALPMGNLPPDAIPRAAHPTIPTNLEIFEEFVHQHERQILNYLWRMTANEQTAWDLSQETFLRAWQHFTKIRAYEQPRAWLFRVATNLAISHLRKQPGSVVDIALLDEDEPETTSDPIHHFVESDLVRQILHTLPPRRRAALILCEVYGFTAPEVAHVLGLTPNALKMTLSRGREQFRQRYAKEMQS